MAVRDIEYAELNRARLQPHLRIADIPNMKGVDHVANELYARNMQPFMPREISIRGIALRFMPSRTWREGLVPTLQLRDPEIILLQPDLSFATDEYTRIMAVGYFPLPEYAEYAQTFALMGNLFMFSKGGDLGRFRRDYTMYVGKSEDEYSDNKPELVLASRLPQSVREISADVLTASNIGVANFASEVGKHLRHPFQGGLVSPR